jgi:hypothetical protein
MTHVRAHERRNPAKVPDPLAPEIARRLAWKRRATADKAEALKRAPDAEIVRVALHQHWLAAEQGGMQ